MKQKQRIIKKIASHQQIFSKVAKTRHSLPKLIRAIICTKIKFFKRLKKIKKIPLQIYNRRNSSLIMLLKVKGNLRNSKFIITKSERIPVVDHRIKIAIKMKASKCQEANLMKSRMTFKIRWHLDMDNLFLKIHPFYRQKISLRVSSKMQII